MGRWEKRTWARHLSVVITVVGLAGTGLIAGEENAALRTEDGVASPHGLRVAIPDHDGLCGGEPCDAVVRGLLHFFDRSPDGQGNGRSCNDCHMVTDHFQLSPADAERRFQFLEWRRQIQSGCRRSALPPDRRG